MRLSADPFGVQACGGCEGNNCHRRRTAICVGRTIPPSLGSSYIIYTYVYMCIHFHIYIDIYIYACMKTPRDGGMVLPEPMAVRRRWPQSSPAPPQAWALLGSLASVCGYTYTIGCHMDPRRCMCTYIVRLYVTPTHRRRRRDGDGNGNDTATARTATRRRQRVRARARHTQTHTHTHFWRRLEPI